MSNIKLLQIGDRPFHIHGQTIFNDYGYTSKSKTQSLMRSNYKTGSDTQFINNVKNISVKGTHVSSGGGYNVDIVRQELNSWVGKPTIIFAYSLSNLENHSEIGCACSSTCDDNCDVLYLQTFGVLKSVSYSSSDNTQPNDITLAIEIFDYWREVDNYTWEWGAGLANAMLRNTTYDDFGYPSTTSYIPPSSKNYYSEFPDCKGLLSCGGCSGFHYRDWGNDNLYYDKDFWFDQYDKTFCYSRNGGTSFKDVTGTDTWYTIQSKKGVWNAPPMSVYQFTGLPDTGNLSIDTKKKNGLTTNEETSSIDLAVLNTALSNGGYTGLLTTDLLYVGDIRRNKNNTLFRPSFVSRSGSVIDVRPEWTYDGWYPGSLGVDYSKFAIDYSGSGDITSFSMSHVHHFRRI